MFQSIKNYIKDISITRQNVGLLLTDFNFHHENVKRHTHNYPTSRLVYDVVSSQGVKVKIIDYNHMITAEALDMEYLNVDEEEKIININQRVYDIVKNYLIQNNIYKVIIPGYYYNWQHPPFPLTPNREWVTNALSTLASEGAIHLLGICGGMQGIVHSHNVKLALVSEMIGRDGAKLHTGFLTDICRARIADVSKAFNRSFLYNNSKLADFSKDQFDLYEGYNDNCKEVRVFELHGIAIDNSVNNIERLEKEGFKVIMKSEEGIIEGIEDIHGNMHFQFHPDYALYYAKDKYQIDNLSPAIKARTLEFAKTIFDEFLNRKHK